MIEDMSYLQMQSQELKTRRHVIWLLPKFCARKTLYNAAVSVVRLASKLKTDNCSSVNLTLIIDEGEIEE